VRVRTCTFTAATWWRRVETESAARAGGNAVTLCHQRDTKTPGHSHGRAFLLTQPAALVRLVERSSPFRTRTWNPLVYSSHLPTTMTKILATSNLTHVHRLPPCTSIASAALTIGGGHPKRSDRLVPFQGDTASGSVLHEPFGRLHRARSFVLGRGQGACGARQDARRAREGAGSSHGDAGASCGGCDG